MIRYVGIPLVALAVAMNMKELLRYIRIVRMSH